MPMKNPLLFENMVAQRVTHLPTMQETWIQSLGQEDLLEKEMATHSNILAWRIPQRESWWAAFHGVTKSQTRLSDFTSLTIYNHKKCLCNCQSHYVCLQTISLHGD